jgi:hypothetical protein
MRAALALAVLLLAGCAAPSHPSASLSPSPPSAPPPEYTLNLRVSQERPDGPPIAGAEVVAFPMDAGGQLGTGMARAADGDGVVRYSFPQPTRLAVRASATGWTHEGAILEIGPTLSSSGAVVSDRDAFLPLYRPSLAFATSLSLSTAFVVPDNGSFQMPLATVTLPFPEGVQAAYLSRLSAAEVTLRWDDTPTSRADLAAGLAWDGALWTQGEASGPGLGPREARFDGPLPADRPADLANARFQAAAVLHTASVGDVPLAFEVTLRFSGQEPPGLPKACHSSEACLPLPPA